MIRKAFILGVLSITTLALLWDFVAEALLYNPFAQIGGIERAVEAKVKSEDVFKPAWGTEILKRNLFSQERSPAPKPAPPAAGERAENAPEPPVRPDVSLTGIILNQFGEYVAYVRIGREEPVPLRYGDELDNIKVAEITERKATLTWNDETIILTMENILRR